MNGKIIGVIVVCLLVVGGTGVYFVIHQKGSNIENSGTTLNSNPTPLTETTSNTELTPTPKPLWLKDQNAPVTENVTSNSNSASPTQSNSSGSGSVTGQTKTAPAVYSTPAPTPYPTPYPTPAPTPAPASVTHKVSIQGFAFGPASQSVKKGDTVVWTNQDSAPHTVTGTGGLNSSTLSAGQSYSFTFSSVGTFTYHCNFHPSMTGSITVTE